MELMVSHLPEIRLAIQSFFLFNQVTIATLRLSLDLHYSTSVPRLSVALNEHLKYIRFWKYQKLIHYLHGVCRGV